MRTVAIILFDDVDVLDFAGPVEVFGVAGGSDRLYEVFTVAEFARPVIARNKLSINPDYCFDEMPRADILVVPGGFGIRREKHNTTMLAFIRDRAALAQSVVSVCSGALLLAKSGLLRGLHAATERGAHAGLAAEESACHALPYARVVANGKFVHSPGIAMGIDAALYAVAKHHGRALATATADYMNTMGLTGWSTATVSCSLT